VRGRLIIDAGAEHALAEGGSLLPVGVVAVEGEFERGDAISVATGDGRDVARGLAAYSSADAAIIQGCRSDEIERLLGYAGRDEIIHRDDMVLLDG
jgi:glutamate 5-kinase